MLYELILGVELGLYFAFVFFVHEIGHYLFAGGLGLKPKFKIIGNIFLFLITVEFERKPNNKELFLVAFAGVLIGLFALLPLMRINLNLFILALCAYFIACCFDFSTMFSILLSKHGGKI